MMPGVLLEYNQSSNLGTMNFKLTFLNISKGDKKGQKTSYIGNFMYFSCNIFFE